MNTGTNEPNLTQLANEWLIAKYEEERANRERVSIEEKMLPFLEQKTEGSVTSELPSGHKITVTNKLTRASDFEAFNKIRDQIPENMRPVKIKEILDDAGVKWLANNEPAVYAILAPCLTVKPAKPGIKVVAPIAVPQ